MHAVEGILGNIVTNVSRLSFYWIYIHLYRIIRYICMHFFHYYQRESYGYHDAL